MSRFIFLAIDLEEKRKKLLGPCLAQLDLRLMCWKEKDTLTINACLMKQTKCGSPWQKLLRSEVDDSWETIVLLADSCCFLLPYCPERLWLHSNPSSWIASLRYIGKQTKHDPRLLVVGKYIGTGQHDRPNSRLNKLVMISYKVNNL